MKKQLENELSGESLQLLRELNVNPGSNYKVLMYDQDCTIDHEWLDEFIEDYNF